MTGQPNNDNENSIELTETQAETVAFVIDNNVADIKSIAEHFGVKEVTVRTNVSRLNSKVEDDKILIYSEQEGGYRFNTNYEDIIDAEEHIGEDEQKREDLNDREEHILKHLLPASVEEIEEELGISGNAVEAHLHSISEKGYTVEYDERTDTYHSDDSSIIRSSEHTGQITREANKWWQKNYDQLERDFRLLDTPDPELDYNKGNQDIVSHITDLHMGDIIYDDDENEVFNSSILKETINYITERQIKLYKMQSELVDFDTWHELWGGDMLTNEGIYKNQYEDLELFLDEQHEQIIDPMINRVKAISEVSDSVQIVCVVGNHGRASGKSKQANADLILYKTIKKQVATLQEHADLLENVTFKIIGSKKYNNFEMRGGNIRGHLRHGQTRKSGFRTSAAQNEWRQTLLNHNFDLAYMGHVHRGQRFHVNGKPVFVTGSPKPEGEFAESIAAGDDDNIALLHGVNDYGMTFSYPIDCREFDPSN